MAAIEGRETGSAVAARGAVRRPLLLVGVALGLAIVSALLLWPGIVVYDTVHQYEQAVSGQIDDWHPPIMARLWELLLALHIGGSGPLLLLQLGLYWGGIGLIAAALARIGAWRAGWAMLLAGLSPLVVDWLVVVVKDAQMVAAMVGTIGLVGWYRLQGRALQHRQRGLTQARRIGRGEHARLGPQHRGGRLRRLPRGFLCGHSCPPRVVLDLRRYLALRVPVKTAMSLGGTFRC